MAKLLLALSLLILTLLTVKSSAQITFEKMYGDAGYELGNALASTTDGGFIITGQTMSYGDVDGDVYVAKISASGDLLWKNHFGGANLDGGNWILQSTDAGYLIIGHTESWGVGDC